MGDMVSQRLERALLLAFFAPAELAALSESEIQLLVALRREGLPELHIKKRRGPSWPLRCWKPLRAMRRWFRQKRHAPRAAGWTLLSSQSEQVRQCSPRILALSDPLSSSRRQRSALPGGYELAAGSRMLYNT